MAGISISASAIWIMPTKSEKVNPINLGNIFIVNDMIHIKNINDNITPIMIPSYLNLIF